MNNYNFPTILQQATIYNALEHSLYQLRTRIIFFQGLANLLIAHDLYNDFTITGQDMLTTLRTNDGESIDTNFINIIRRLISVSNNNDLENYQIMASHADIATIRLAIGQIKEVIPHLRSAIKILTSSAESTSLELSSLFTMAETNVLLLKTELEAVENILIPRLLTESVTQ